MTKVRTHLLLPPLETPPPDRYRTDTAALRNAAALYEQLIGKGYDEATADRLSSVGRLTGADVKFEQPEETP
jgi:hypothetical protein